MHTGIRVSNVSSKIFFLFAISYFAYTFISPFASAKGYLFVKTVFSIATLGLAIIYFSWDASRQPKTAHIFLLSWTCIAIPAYVGTWNNIDEINILLTPLIGYVAFRGSDLFKKFLAVFFCTNLIFISYEWLVGEYLYTEVIIGIGGAESYVVDPSKFGDVGFRPKGLLFGTLDAAALCIAFSMIFLDKRLLFLSAAGALLVNGRLAVILTIALLLLRIYQEKNIRHNAISIIKFAGSVSFTIAIAIFMLFSFLDDKAIENLLAVTDLTSTSNSARIEFIAAGLAEYSKYPLENLIFGDSGYFKSIYGNSAESGVVNLLLNAGLVGVFLYVTPLVFIITKAVRCRELWVFGTGMAAFAALFVFRFEAGYLRGTLYWFFVFYSIRQLKLKQIETLRNQPRQGLAGSRRFESSTAFQDGTT